MAASDVTIVGAGLAGLCCARALAERNITFTIVEASDAVGGRARTDTIDGFKIDRGFQVLLTAYPEAKRVLDYAALELKPFYPGALVRFAGRFHKVADPRKKPLDAAAGFLSPIASFSEKARLAWLDQRTRFGTLEDLWNRPERQTIELLREAGFGDPTIDRFFRPFFGGVFFDRDLQTSSRMFEFVFRMFGAGDTALPAAGMGAIAAQLASRLPADSIRLNSPAKSIEPGSVMLTSGETLKSRAVVIATDADAAHRLLGSAAPQRRWRTTTTLSFAAPTPPINNPALLLDGDATGPVNHACVPSLVQPTYAPPGKSLISLSVVDQKICTQTVDNDLEAACRSQMANWFDRDTVKSWQLIRIDRIAHALPDQTAGSLTPPRRPTSIRPGLHICGDHLDNASINGAMESGRRAAEALVAELHAK